METNPKQTQRAGDNLSENERGNDPDSLQERNKMLTYILGGLGALLLAVILYFALSGESNYEKGRKYLGQKQYTEALVEFQKVDTGDKDFRMAQSKINYINGLRAYNDNLYPQAKTYLTKVDASDEYYRESQLMIEKMNLASKQQSDLQLLSEQVNKAKDTVIIKERVVETPPSTTINEASPDPDSEPSRTYVTKLENLVSKFESQYQSALKADIDSKKIYLKYMDSLNTEFNKMNSSKDNAAVRELNRLTSSWMQKRENLINRLIADNAISETAATRSLKEDGDREYSLLLSRLKM